MRFTDTEVAGAYIVDFEPEVDECGFSARTYCTRELAEQGLSLAVAQDNLFHSDRRGTLRGLHAQVQPVAQSRLVQCVRGAVFDVAVDLRPESPSYLRHVGVELTEDNRRALFIPEECFHGFLTLADNTEVAYKADEFAAPGHAVGYRYDDPAFGIDWPIEVAVISREDRSWPAFQPGEIP